MEQYKTDWLNNYCNLWNIDKDILHEVLDGFKNITFKSISDSIKSKFNIKYNLDVLIAEFV